MAESDLPEEVMMSILCWLPVKSLIRFTSVSKRWRFIILSDPQFAASQFEAARQRKTLVPRLIFSTNAPQLESVDVADTASFGHPSTIRLLSLPLEQQRGPPRDVRLLGSCNGLVFVAFDAVSCFYIWNPATGFFKELPEPGFTNGQELMYHGVGYLSATDDYRVFAATYGLRQDRDEDEDEDEGNWVETEEMKMFSSRAHGVILAFDFALEEFRTMRLPDTDDSDYEYGVNFKNVGVSEGCLCVCSKLSERSVNFWVMREYGVDDSWSKLFNFTHGVPDLYGNFLVMGSCTVASNWDMPLHQALVKIDHKQEKEIGTYIIQSSWHNSSLNMFSYEESLLRIND
ncbi:PREDICTED: F-box protein CPR30-like [Fragaria vesca subsp. vesca]